MVGLGEQKYRDAGPRLRESRNLGPALSLIPYEAEREREVGVVGRKAEEQKPFGGCAQCSL